MTQLSYIAYCASELMDLPQRGAALMEVIKTGIPDYKGDPIHMYRERIIRSHTDTNAIKRENKWYTLKYCWNLFAKKKTTGVLRFDQENVAIEGLDLKRL